MKLRAGLARRDITPALGTPSGLTLREAVDEVWDPLTATALVLESGTTRLALVGLDLMGVLEASHRRIREAVTRATGIPDEHVVINVSHTHSAPYLSDDLQAILAPHRLRVMDEVYADLVVERVAEAVAEAAASIRPVTGLRSGRGRVERVAANRRPRDAGGRVVHRYGRADEALRALPEGVIDPEVATLVLDGDEGRPIGALFVYACHPTAAGSGTHTHVSADFVGRARALAEATYGLPCLYLQGCAGNQGTGKWIAGSPADDTQAMGSRLAAGITEALSAARATAPDLLAVASTTIVLDFDPFPPLERLEADLAAAAAIDDFGPIIALGDALAVARRIDELRVARITALALGEIALVILPGEVFVEHGLAIRSRSPFRETIVAAYNDNTLQYIPTAPAFSEGSYEVEGGWRYIRAGEGERIVATAIGLLEGIRRRHP